MAPRTQASRDAQTVEIVYALITAAFFAGIIYATVAVPFAIWHVHGFTADCVLITTATIATAVGVGRIVTLLRSSR